MFMAYHSSPHRKPILVAIFLTLVLFGIGVGLAVA